MPPNYIANNILIFVLSFGSYYLGIFIRKKAMPGSNSPPLKYQFLLGIPVSLLVVSAFIPIIRATLTDWVLLFTLGLIMEQGMLLNETLTKKILIERTQISRSVKGDIMADNSTDGNGKNRKETSS